MAVTKLTSSTPDIKPSREPQHTTPLREKYFSVLLGLQIVTLFFISPVVGNSGTQYNWIIDVFLILMACVSVFAFRNPLERKLTMFIFAVCITGLAFSPFITDYKLSAILFTLSGVIFCAIVSWTVGEKLFAEGPVTLHRIQGAIVIYLNIAMTFAGLDNLLVYLLPNAYSNISPGVKDNISTMIYFSFTTLTTTGYGDIVPLHPYARSLASLESVIGQFYLATLIALLVGLHVSHRNKVHSLKQSD